MADLFVETGVASLPKHGEELCGDTVKTTKTDASLITVLSDGLGSGVKANILSTLTATIAATMLRAGAALEATIETIGETLPTCQVRKIAYATLGAVEIGRDGQAFVAEFDTPELLLFRNMHHIPLERTSRRLGQRMLEVNEAHFWVEKGDYLICVSDGVVHAGVGGKLKLGLGRDGLQQYLADAMTPEMSAQTVAEAIVSYARHLYDGKPGDDTTACVLRMRTAREVMVVVGPPKHGEMDGQFARQLADFPGQKVVCGGTTSKLIARELKRDLKVNLDDASFDYPPTGSIAGIDLVTEGIITLAETLSLLEEGMHADAGQRPAGKLASILFDCDCAHFHVGRAINPAHQNPVLPFDLSLKQQIVDRVCGLLEDMGKAVTVDYY